MNELDELDQVLSDIAARIAKSRHGFDYGEMDAETAFDSAINSISTAINDVLYERRHRKGVSK